MTNRIFFCYDHNNDSWRSNQIVQRWLLVEGNEAAGIIDPAGYQALKKQGEEAIKSWVDKELAGCSLNVVLIGNHTSEDSISKYSILKSMKDTNNNKNAFLGIYIHKIKNEEQERDEEGSNPLENFYWRDKEKNVTFISDVFKTYDWFAHKGPQNFLSWVTEAEKIAEGLR